MESLKRRWPLLLAVVVLWLAIGLTFHATWVATSGDFAYALDDPYIHLAIAKNLAMTGVWGVTPDGFSSAASSLVWPLLLALGIKLAGVSLWPPLVWNVGLATALLWVVDRCMAPRRRAERLVAAVVMIGVIGLMPLPANVLIGMEHVLQTLVMLPVMYWAAKAIAGESGSRAEQVGLLVGIALLPAIRYEGLFAVAAVCLLLALRRRLGLAIALGAVSLVPIGLFGLYSLAQGWFFVPNPILIKGGSPAGLLPLLQRGGAQWMATPHLLGLSLIVGATMVGRWRSTGNHTVAQAFGGLFLLTALQHMLLASTGWFYRYEAYLMAWGLLSLGLGFQEWLGLEPAARRAVVRSSIAAGVVMVTLYLVTPWSKERLWSLLSVPEGTRYRTATSFTQLPGTSRHIRDQQVQMGRFLATYYTGAGVAANDIGAINYYARIRCLDLVGLADIEVARLMRAGRFDRAALERLARERGVSIAIVYAHWFPRGFPPDWIRVGRWTFDGAYEVPRATVSFLAVGPAERDRLATRLKAFAPTLPPNVRLHLEPEPTTAP